MKKFITIADFSVELIYAILMFSFGYFACLAHIESKKKLEKTNTVIVEDLK
jgi:hypothetical protein